jgi:hypothetical protein
MGHPNLGGNLKLPPKFPHRTSTFYLPPFMNVKLFLLPILLLFCFHSNGQNAVVFSVSNMTVNTGADFVVPVKTQNFTDVSSFSVSLSWDEAYIDFDTIVTFNTDLPLNFSNFNMTPAVTDAGKLAVSWFDISGLGKSLADNTTLFEIKFKSLSNPGASLLQFTEDLAPIIAENLQGLLPVSTTPATITVQAANSTDEASLFGDISLYPNPAQEAVLLQYSLLDASPVIVEIIDLNGKLLEQQKYVPATFGEINLDVSGFPSGNYIIRIATEKGVISKKLGVVRG